jgi:hypothetical protein
MKRSQTLERKILRRITRKKAANVFLRDDFSDLGGYDQVGRILKNLVQKGTLIKIGYGLYAKTKVSSITGQVVPTATLPKLGREALDRLKVSVLPTKAEQAYKEGRSTQVPTGRMIGVKGRVSRKIGYKGAYIAYEHVS